MALYFRDASKFIPPPSIHKGSVESPILWVCLRESAPPKQLHSMKKISKQISFHPTPTKISSTLGFLEAPRVVPHQIVELVELVVITHLPLVTHFSHTPFTQKIEKVNMLLELPTPPCHAGAAAAAMGAHRCRRLLSSLGLTSTSRRLHPCH